MEKSTLMARNYSVTFGYYTKYVSLPEWIFDRYTNDAELLDACIKYINNITCNVCTEKERFELCIK